MLPFSLNVSNTAIWSAFQPTGKKRKIRKMKKECKENEKLGGKGERW
jgi:hypothetical protein